MLEKTGKSSKDPVLYLILFQLIMDYHVLSS